MDAKRLGAPDGTYGLEGTHGPEAFWSPTTTPADVRVSFSYATPARPRGRAIARRSAGSTAAARPTAAATAPTTATAAVVLLRRLRERQIVQWMLGYLAAAWFLLQAMDVLGEIWMWSLLAQQAISLVLGIGVLPAMVVAWYHGEKGRQRICAMEVTLLAASIMGLVVAVWSYCFSVGVGPLGPLG